MSRIAITFEQKDRKTNPECAFYNLLASCGVSTIDSSDYKIYHMSTTLYIIGSMKQLILAPIPAPAAIRHVLMPSEKNNTNDVNFINMYELINKCKLGGEITKNLIEIWTVVWRYLCQRTRHEDEFHEIYMNDWINELIDILDNGKVINGYKYKFKIMLNSINTIFNGTESPIYVADFINNPRLFIMAKCSDVTYVDSKYADLVPVITTSIIPVEHYVNIYESLSTLVPIGAIKQILDYLLVNYTKLLTPGISIDDVIKNMDDIVLSTRDRYMELESIIDYVNVRSYWHKSDVYRVAVSKKCVNATTMDRLIISGLISSGHELFMAQSELNDGTYYIVKCVPDVPDEMIEKIGTVSFVGPKYMKIITNDDFNIAKFKVSSKSIING